MSLDRAELAGTGVAILFHAGLIAALSMSLAGVNRAPEPPAMEVELVEEVILASAAPTPVVAPPVEQAPVTAEAKPEEIVQPRPEPLPPSPRVEPAPAPRPAERSVPPPKAPPVAAPAAPARPAPRVARIGDDFLKGIAEATQPVSQPAAPAFSAAARASITQAIRRQIQPCADQQVNPGPGANRISVTLNLRLSRGGRLIQPPQVVRTSGVDDENARFEDRVKDLAVAAYVGCSPLTGLPQELYQTPEGGWSNINMTYRLP
ncbi:MAG TPA: hypothetical protein VM346_11320 [Sphingomicrobium sp.]|nr:hypothetical protein [Sphingomicrobium sp.]